MIFGRGMGAADLLPTGFRQGRFTPARVTLPELKENLWKLYDQINPPPVKLIISDLDDTLVDYSTYHTLGMQKGFTRLSEKLDRLGKSISEDELYRLANDGQVLEKNDWALELALADRLNIGKPGNMTASEFHRDLIEPFWNEIAESRKQHIKLLPGVMDTLAELKRRDVSVAILSNGSAHSAVYRVVETGLDKVIDRMFALEPIQEPFGLSDELLAAGRSRIAGAKLVNHQLQELYALPREWRKPHRQGIEMLISRFSDDGKPLRPSQVRLIGDSLKSDAGAAQSAGVQFIWAKYGLPAKQYMDIYKHLDPDKPSAAYPDEASYRIAKSFACVLNELNVKPNFSALWHEFSAGLAQLPRWQSLMTSSILDGGFSNNNHFHTHDGPSYAAR